MRPPAKTGNPAERLARHVRALPVPTTGARHVTRPDPSHLRSLLHHQRALPDPLLNSAVAKMREIFLILCTAAAVFMLMAAKTGNL